MLVHTLYGPQGTVERPNWKDVEQAIRGLDDARLSVSLSAHPEGGMTISRIWSPDYLVVGPHGAYITDPGTGRPTDRVNLDTTLKAAKHFLEFGELDSSIQWWNP